MTVQVTGPVDSDHFAALFCYRSCFVSAGVVFQELRTMACYLALRGLLGTRRKKMLDLVML